LDQATHQSHRTHPFETEREASIIKALEEWKCKFHPLVKCTHCELETFKAGIEAAPTIPRPHRIGIWDYQSLVACLRESFDTVFPGEDMCDPQNGIWRLAAEALNLRRKLAEVKTQKSAVIHQIHRLVARFDEALRTEPGPNLFWREEGIRSFAVETLRRILGE
jgi:hypothetical protein